MNTKVKTWVGTVIIIIVAITAGVFVWLYEKNQGDGQFYSCKKMIQVCGSGNAGCRWECQDNFIPTNAPKTNVPTFKPSVPANNNSGVDETADWQTYRNDKYGFEIKYPEKIEFKTLDSNGQVVSSSTSLYFEDLSKGIHDLGTIAEKENIFFGLVRLAIESDFTKGYRNHVFYFPEDSIFSIGIKDKPKIIFKAVNLEENLQNLSRTENYGHLIFKKNNIGNENSYFVTNEKGEDWGSPRNFRFAIGYYLENNDYFFEIKYPNNSAEFLRIEENNLENSESGLRIKYFILLHQTFRKILSTFKFIN